jgi:hypothetical protein
LFFYVKCSGSGSAKRILISVVLLEKTMGPNVLHFWLESHWISVSNVFSGVFDSLFVLFSVLAVYAVAGLVTKSTEREAFTIHFETFGFATFAT